MYKLIRSGSHPAEDTFDKYWRFQVDCGADLCSYATQLKRWQATFGKSRVLVRFYEDLSSDPQGYLDAICDFIGARRIALDSATAGRAKVYSAPTAAHSNTIGRRTFAAVTWASHHGARSLIALGRRTALWKLMREKFVDDFQPLNEESAEGIRTLMLPETEELERITGRDLSGWKSRVQRNLANGSASVRSQTE
jgi:hypothetical protein